MMDMTPEARRQSEGTARLNEEARIACLAPEVPKIDDDMTLDDYSAWVAGRMMHGDKNLTIALLGLAGEVGEVMEIFKKNLDRGRPIDQNTVKLELGDILFYLVAIASIVGLDLNDVATGNIEKLIARDGARNERYHERR